MPANETRGAIISRRYHQRLHVVFRTSIGLCHVLVNNSGETKMETPSLDIRIRGKVDVQVSVCSEIIRM